MNIANTDLPTFFAKIKLKKIEIWQEQKKVTSVFA